MTSYFDWFDWKVGDEVECVDTSKDVDGVLLRFPNYNWDPDLDGLTKGMKYKIREFCLHPITNDLCIKVVGVTRGDKDWPYSIKRFRKLQKRKTDISQFQAMLNQTLLTNQIELTVKGRMPKNA